jgi:hypothetical protein
MEEPAKRLREIYESIKEGIKFEPQENVSVDGVMRDFMIRITILATRLAAIEKVMTYYNSSVKDKLLTAWIEELKLIGCEDIAAALENQNAKDSPSA